MLGYFLGKGGGGRWVPCCVKGHGRYTVVASQIEPVDNGLTEVSDWRIEYTLLNKDLQLLDSQILQAESKMEFLRSVSFFEKNKQLIILGIYRYHRIDMLGVFEGKLTPIIPGLKVLSESDAIHSWSWTNDSHEEFILGGVDWIYKVKIIYPNM